MSQRLTTAALSTLAHSQRVSLFFRLRKAAVGLPSEHQAIYRIAARFLLGSVDNAATDMIARVQILEGVAGIVSPGPMSSGPWSKNPRRGLAAAKDFFADTDIDPSWVSTGNTGLISKVYGMVSSALRSWARGREVSVTADDIIQYGLAGMTKDMGQYSKGPLFFQFGAFNPGAANSIKSGKASPRDVAGIVGKFYVQKVQNEFTKGERGKVQTTDDEGRSVFDRMTKSPAEFYTVLSDLLSVRNSPVHQMIKKQFERELGEGKWAEIAYELFTAELSGKRVVKQDLAAKHQMAPGTLSKVIRTQVRPAIDNLRKSKWFLNQIRDVVERHMMRRAYKQLVHRTHQALSA